MSRAFSIFLFCIGCAVAVSTLVGCTQVKVAQYTDDVCEMACDGAEDLTLDKCKGVCDNALAGRALDLKLPCYYACEEAVMIGKPKCVDACDAGVKAAIEAI